YRTLGRTGLKVSELGLGTIKIDSPAVVRRAMDLGITYFDTAECYQGGKSEEKLGRALQGRRDGVIVATKWHTDGSTSAGDLLASLDASLRRLQLEYVDLIQIHGASKTAQVESDELWEAFNQAKKAGKVRFQGLSSHGNQAEVVRAAIKSKRYDAVLVSYNALLAERVGPAVADAHAANVGVIAMKALQPAHRGKETDAFKGLPGNPYQQSIQWLLRDRNVGTVIVDMPTFGEVDEDVAAVKMHAQADLAGFERAVAGLSLGTCHLCGSCTAQCPRGVQVADIMRCDLYRTGYGDRARAADVYRSLSLGGSAASCGDCEQCSIICPWGVSVREKLVSTHAALV
ncbi:MAG: aldo/keto reductase, partial [Armatimonadetes bacterium]|nr:aldo/keto reductase [Armatimonadota bacterium]